MNFITKLIVATLTIAATIVGSIWTGYEKIDSRMDEKVREGKQEVYTIMNTLKTARDTEIKGLDDKTAVQLVAVKGEIVELRKDVRELLIHSRKARVDKRPNSYYTNIETEKNEGKL